MSFCSIILVSSSFLFFFLKKSSKIIRVKYFSSQISQIFAKLPGLCGFSRFFIRCDLQTALPQKQLQIIRYFQLKKPRKPIFPRFEYSERLPTYFTVIGVRVFVFIKQSQKYRVVYNKFLYQQTKTLSKNTFYLIFILKFLKII